MGNLIGWCMKKIVGTFEETLVDYYCRCMYLFFQPINKDGEANHIGQRQSYSSTAAVEKERKNRALLHVKLRPDIAYPVELSYINSMLIMTWYGVLPRIITSV